MTSFRVAITSLGPLKNTEIEIAIPNITVLYGSNVSGKSLLGIVSIAMLQAVATTRGATQLCKALNSIRSDFHMLHTRSRGTSYTCFSMMVKMSD